MEAAAAEATDMAPGGAATGITMGCAAIGMDSAVIGSTWGVSAAIAIAAVAAAITVAAPISPATVTPTAAPAPVVPGSGANEEAAGEPARTVIAVGSARIRVIRIVAPIASRGTIGIGRVHHRRTDANTDCDLSICRRGENQRQSQEYCHQNQPKIFHETLPVLPSPTVRDLEFGSITSASQHPPEWVFSAHPASVHLNNKGADKLR
jgi:hypothetical protein